jgi:glucarate dehydratase
MPAISRREALAALAGAPLLAPLRPARAAAEPAGRDSSLKITGLKVTPIALPDPPLLAAAGCHGPYFLRNIVQIETDAGITGVGETTGGAKTVAALEEARKLIVGKSALAYRAFADAVEEISPRAYAGIELACLDAAGKATGRRLCELLGGPVREQVEFAAYLFYRYAADHPTLLADPRVVDGRGKGDKALDQWGEVRTPEAMTELADRFRRQFGFTVFKLKAGVLKPEAELDTMRQMHARFGGKHPLRIDPNAWWSADTAVRIGLKLRDLNIEYYEDPVRGRPAMAEVRARVGLPMSTNMCVTRFEHVPEALRLKSVDVVLSDIYFWGGVTGCQELGRVCRTHGWKMSQHSNNHGGLTMAAMIHVGAVCRDLTIASDTHYPWLPESADILEGGKLPIKDGKMAVPAGPGLGVKVNWDKVAGAAEVYAKCGMKERDDAFTMRLVEPGWKRELL